jgi:hypothetical protein
MRIDSCEFGSIVIDGRKYTSDLIIYPDGRVETSWRRRFGHRLSGDDIGELIASGPDVIVAGTGLSGLVKPEEELEELLHNMAIEFFPAPNQQALEIYNELSTKKKVGACFHLTC